MVPDIPIVVSSDSELIDMYDHRFTDSLMRALRWPEHIQLLIFVSRKKENDHNELPQPLKDIIR
jgi:hypothetical protein